VQRSKTDRTDVKDMLEAGRNSDIRPVPIKTESQQQLTSLHRIRSTWMSARTTLRVIWASHPVNTPWGMPAHGPDQQTIWN
jgi:transposase